VHATETVFTQPGAGKTIALDYSGDSLLQRRKVRHRKIPGRLWEVRDRRGNGIMYQHRASHPGVRGQQ
jgi:hypothetical protein